MRIGILSDAHGNAYGLDKCLVSLKGLKVERFFHLGDTVGYFPRPNEVLAKLRLVNAACLMGNHEAMLLGLMQLNKTKDKIYRIEECRKKISKQDRKHISEWLPFCERRIHGQRLLFVHGSPWDPLNGYVYPDSDLGAFASLPYDAVFMGHTHVPFVLKVGGVLVVNVGSCGLPRDRGNRLSCAIYDTKGPDCKIVHVAFDARVIARKYRAGTSKIVIDRLASR